MKIAKLFAAALLTFSLYGCDQLNNSSNNNSGNAQGRSGAMGITSQGIDDLAKPDPKPQNANPPAGNPAP